MQAHKYVILPLLLMGCTSSFVNADIIIWESFIAQVNEVQLVEALIKKELSVGNTVLYGKKIYAISAFEIVENIDFCDVFVTLEEKLTYLGIVWGDVSIKIKVTKKPRSLYLTERIYHIKPNNKCRVVGATLYFAIIGFAIKLGFDYLIR